MYKLTHNKTGHSFKMSFKETADFFYTKNAHGEYINWLEDYELEEVRKIDYEFLLLLTSTTIISFVCLYYFLKWN